ncbi:MAG: hypothetical protein IAG13_10320 [Deltaproteobacteria bacterium]|nr:hypothetical protein [Nannocystaceae bacterium]
MPSSVTAVMVARRCCKLASLTGRTADALVEAERGAAVAERFYGSDHPIAALTRIELATALMAAGRGDAALAQARSGLDLLERTTAADDPPRILALLLLAELQRERDEAASGRHRSAAETIAQLGDTHRLAHADATFSIALASDDRVRAHELADIAHGRARRLGDERLAARITSWLAR